MKKLTFYLFSALLISLKSVNAQAPTIELDKVLIPSTAMGQPWGMDFITSDELLFTEKSGKLFRYVISTNTKTQIGGTPTVANVGQGGLLDVALHPDFATNKYVYLSYSISGSGGYTLAVGRGVLSGSQLTNFSEIFRALPFKSGTNHFGSRIAFDADNHIYFSASERQEQDNAQLLTNHLGKIIRLNDDGSVPSDNPFVNTPNAQPEIYSYGHRNIQGLVIDPTTGKIYAHEHGPRGGDELNLIEAGNNYGWPSITFGINYDGTIISEDTAREGMEQPMRYWVPSIAPCGLAIVPLQNEAPTEVNFIIGALAGTEVQWVKTINDNDVATYSFMDGYARFRDVEVAPDGKIYALTESPNRFVLLKTNQTVTSIEQTKTQGQTQIYPNPVTNVLNVSEFAEVFDITGIKVAEGEGKIDVSSLEKGIYLVKTANSIVKIVKE
jgi:glucose/arabinose dehydrogenase